MALIELTREQRPEDINSNIIRTKDHKIPLDFDKYDDWFLCKRGKELFVSRLTCEFVNCVYVTNPGTEQILELPLLDRIWLIPQSEIKDAEVPVRE